MKPARIAQARPAGPDHRVVTVEHGGDLYRRRPCSDCPWRKDAVGQFPAEAFRLSASTAYDVPDAVAELMRTGKAPGTFGCHQSGARKPATCAGFLLSESATHNFTLRLRGIQGHRITGLSDAGHELFATYREMAEANGVSPDDPVLKPCR